MIFTRLRGVTAYRMHQPVWVTQAILMSFPLVAFMDTRYAIALLSRQDQYHPQAGVLANALTKEQTRKKGLMKIIFFANTNRHLQNEDNHHV